MKTSGIRAVAILIKDNQVLLMHRTRDGKEFWVFPGGGKEEDESVEEAVVREVYEEATIKCTIVKLLYIHIYSDLGHKKYYYLCKYESGTPKLGGFNEKETMEKGEQTYKPMWISLVDLPKMLLYPLEIRDWLIQDYKTNFNNTPRTATLKSTDLRQEI